MKDTVLVGTFLRDNKLPGRITREIVETFGVDKLFVFEVFEEDTDNRRFLVTFNISKDDKETRLREFKSKHSNTIQLHRNKEYDVLYTINSLNEVVSKQNGQKDPNYQVDWSKYERTCLVTGDDGLRVLSTRLYDIIEL